MSLSKGILPDVQCNLNFRKENVQIRDLFLSQSLPGSEDLNLYFLDLVAAIRTVFMSNFGASSQRYVIPFNRTGIDLRQI